VFLKRYDFNDSIPDPGGTGCWLSITALAQASTVIPESEAPQQIGQNATVEGVVTAVSTSKRGNTFINFGGVYPNQTFTGWIPAGTPLASDPSLQSLQGKKIKITGLIELYRGKPEIRILSRDQITEE
jgi:DNA/RNA endonuclease YhcR with UshA esterase domain